MRIRLLRLMCCCLLIVQLCGLAAFTSFAAPEWPHNVAIQAEGGIVIDADTGAVLFGQNIHQTYYPASITKLLTALIVLENCDDLDEIVTYSNTALTSVESGSGNKLSLQTGDTLTVRDSLYGLLLVSANQCANGLAEHVAGSMSAFVDMMNAKLEELGLTESHFDNPSGLNGSTQYVSPYDMAFIARAAFNNPDLLTISSTLSYHIGPTQAYPNGQSIRHEHRLLYTTDPTSQFYCPEAIAGKTGYLIAAGNTLVTYGEKDGRRCVSVVLRGTTRQYFLDGKSLLQFGLNNFKNVNIAENEDRVEEGFDDPELERIWRAYSDLYIDPSAYITLPLNAEFSDADVTVVTDLEEDVPVGTVARLVYSYNDRVIGSANLITAGGSLVSVGAVSERDSSWLTFNLPDIPWMTILLILVVIALIAAVIAWIYWMVATRKQETREMKARKARRRARLKSREEEAEFNRLMKERWGHESDITAPAAYDEKDDKEQKDINPDSENKKD